MFIDGETKAHGHVHAQDQLAGGHTPQSTSQALFLCSIVLSPEPISLIPAKPPQRLAGVQVGTHITPVCVKATCWM